MVTVLENNLKRIERCDYCDSILEFDREDIIIEKENVHHLPKVIGYYIICPCCGNKVNTGSWFKCL